MSELRRRRGADMMVRELMFAARVPMAMRRSWNGRWRLCARRCAPAKYERNNRT